LNKFKEYKRYPITLSLILLNILIFIIIPHNIHGYAFFSMYNGSPIYTFLTSLFMHGNISHLLLNMIGLLIFGFYLEQKLSKKEFLILYFGSGFMSSLFAFIYINYINTHAFVIGSSGAIFGLYAFFSYYIGNKEIKSFWLNVIIFHILLFVINMPVAWYGHLGGIIFGLSYFYLNLKKPKYKF